MCSKVAEAIYDLIHKAIRFNWTGQCQQDMDKVKKLVTDSPLLFTRSLICHLLSQLKSLELDEQLC